LTNFEEREGDMAKIGNRVREWRLKSLVRTQRELSRQTGIKASTLSKIENNRVTLSVQNACIIARVLRLHLDDLYEQPASAPAGVATG
jgi:transcriptional regulator with XRE-family HTH domain